MELKNTNLIKFVLILLMRSLLFANKLIIFRLCNVIKLELDHNGNTIPKTNIN